MLSLDWIGGFFDADGSITLSKRVRRRDGNERLEFVPAIQLGQSDPGILEEISRVIGGSVYRVAVRGSGNSQGIIRNRDAYSLRADNGKAIEICKLLIPVVRCKKAEMEEVVRFYEKYNNYTKGWARYGGEEYTKRYKELIEQGDACRSRLNLLRNNKDTIYVSLQEE